MQTEMFGTQAPKAQKRKQPQHPPGAVEHLIDGHPVRVVSVFSPWAWLTVNGHKPVENRTFLQTFMVGNTCLIQSSGVGASKPKLQKEYDLARWMIDEHALNIEMPKLNDIPVGGVMGLVKCTFAGDEASAAANGVKYSPWFVGPYGYWWKDAKAFESPITYTGGLGFRRAMLLPVQWSWVNARRLA